MALNSDIRDQAYQFFIEEAPELLQVIETGLLTLRQEHSTAKVHNLMRAAHSIKGGAASVELEAIATLAHRLENIFKALYSETLEIDTDLESQLLQAYDCLRLPLMEQIMRGFFDEEQALAVAEPLFAQIEEELGDALTQAENYIPSSSDLGIDMGLYIFEMDVQQGLDHLAHVVEHPSDYEVAGELRAQAEVFSGFAELLNKPGFGAIAATTIAALEAHPNRALEITQLALTDFQLARQAVLAGDASSTSPSAALVALASSNATNAPDFTTSPVVEAIADSELIVEQTRDTIPSLEDVFGSAIATPQTDIEELLAAAEVLEDKQTADEDRKLEEIFAISSEFSVENAVADEDRKSEEIFASSSESSVENTVADEDRKLEEIFASSSESSVENTVADEDRKLEEIFASSSEFSVENAVADEDRKLEEIFASSSEFSVENTVADEDRKLEEIFASSSEFSIENTVADEDKKLEEIFASSSESSVENTVADEDRKLEEIFASSSEFSIENTVADEDRKLEEIFASSSEFSVENTVADEDRKLEEIFASSSESSVENTVADEDRKLEEIFASSSESSVENTVADEDRKLEEIFASSSESSVENTLITSEAETDASDSSEIIDIDVKLVTDDAISVREEAAEETPSLSPIFSTRKEDREEFLLRELFGIDVVTLETEASTSSAIVPVTSRSRSLQEQRSDVVKLTDTSETLEVAVQSIEQIFETLPPIEDIPAPTSESNPTGVTAAKSPAKSKTTASPTPNLSVRVDSERLGRMNNLVGELAINRNGLSLQNDQLQGSVRELLNRFVRVQNMVSDLRKLSDQMLVGTSSSGSIASNPGFFSAVNGQRPTDNGQWITDNSQFDSLELDSYGALHSQLQGLLEDMMQLEESVDDIVLFARATDQTLEQQRQMLTQLRDELMWARMLPLGEVLHRFPRMLRDLSTTYHKPVNLKLVGTSVLVDKAVLEKLYDPLLHLLRNAFDHGIELPEIRRSQGKPQQGQIEIRAYHRGSQTIIEVRDDGQGLNLERIGRRALEMGLLSPEQLATISHNRLQEFIFEPGFSTATEVSKLSGRGVGLDVVRGQLRSLKGTISANFSPGVGTTFTLRLPLTLTIAKLLVCFIGATAVAIPSDSIEEIIVPKAEQIKQSGAQRLLYWRGQLVPTYRLADCLDYSCPLPDFSPSKALIAVPSPKTWALPMLVLRQEQQVYALEIDRLVTEQELVIKPFGGAIAPPSCTYGCTILGDGSLIPVIDAAVLLEQILGKNTAEITTTTRSSALRMVAMEWQDAAQTNENSSLGRATNPIKTPKTPTILVVDDAAALRRTLALTLERAGCRVLQARDGREALEQLQQSFSVSLVVCDIEMPNMNGFEFLSHRRQEPRLLEIPVVMLTSRSNDKHRWLAMQLGATAYFTKPYLEQEFLSAIQQLIGQNTPEIMPARSHR